MAIKIKKESINSKAYYIGLALLIYRYIFATSYLNNEWMSILSWIGILFEIFHILFIKHNAKFYVLFLASLILGILSFNQAQSLTILYFFIIVFASYNVECTRFIKLLYHTIITSILIVSVFSIIGIIPIINANNYITFGFLGKNGLCIYIMTLLVLYMYLHYEKKSTKTNIVILCILIFVSIWLQGKTSFISALIIVIMMIFSKKMLDSYNRRMLCLFFALCAVMISFLVYRTIHFGECTLDWAINDLLTGRLLQANYYYKKYGFSMYGSVLKEFADESHYFLDFGYMNMIIQNGYIYFLVNIVVYCWSVISLIKKNDIKTALLVMYVLLILIGENVFCNPFFNPVYPIYAFFFIGRAKYLKK